jgi:glycosyltransferase involved in cell wall biosynthesis
MTLIALIVAVFYVILIVSFVYGFDKIEAFKLEDIPVKTKFTIIVPFRNEAEKLPLLLKSVSELNYPNTHFEFIFVDDESNDNSVELIKNFEASCSIESIIINNERRTNSPKKDAITNAIIKAKYEWIVTTDADCILPKYWLDTFDCFIQKNDTKFIVAPVSYTKTDSFFNRFQALDFLSLQGATIGAFGIKKPFLCNAANLAFKASLFKALNGYVGNTHIASGDDIFILEKAVKQEPEHIHYLKSLQATVLTFAQPDLKSLIAQRLRWASKTTNYSNLFGKFVGLLIFAMNATIICFLMFSIMGVFHFKILAYLFVIKFCVDFLLLFKTSRFLDQENILLSYIFASIIYPFFCVYIAVTSIFKSYKWKDRTFKL